MDGTSFRRSRWPLGRHHRLFYCRLFGLSVTKISAGFVGHSFALVADGLESGADVLSGLVVFFGLKIAVKPPDTDHPYGHGKAEPIAVSGEIKPVEWKRGTTDTLEALPVTDSIMAVADENYFDW